MTHARWPALLALASLATVGGPLSAGDLYPDKETAKIADATLPKPADVQSLDVKPDKLTLKGLDDAQQLILTASLAGGKLQDLSGDVKYEVQDPKVARVTTNGRVIPLANGTTTVTATYGPKAVKVEVKAEACDVDLPINFANQIVPIFTKLGCNSGGCHGKASGQNGFRLSLLGFEPDLDYMTLVKEGRGRRIFPASPDASLLLSKASGAVAHGGGKRMEAGSDEYRLIRRWIASGVPLGDEKDPVVKKITVFPEHRVHAQQQAAVRRLRPLQRRLRRGHHPAGAVREQRPGDRGPRHGGAGPGADVGDERRGRRHDPLPGVRGHLPGDGAAGRHAGVQVRGQDGRR